MDDIDKWVVRFGRQSGTPPRLRLICFPYAGCGPTVFHSWSSYFPPEVELWGIKIPGKEKRIHETPFNRLIPLAEAVSSVLQPYLDQPYAFFGHSVGALTSYEVAHHLRKSDGLQPVCLLLSGHRAPHRPPLNPPFHHVEETAFLERLRQFGGTPEEFFQSEELVQFLLPSLRADFAMWETYTYKRYKPLECPLSIFGSYGDTEATVADFEAWRMHTTGQFSLQMFGGGHFYFQKYLPAFLQTISETLQQHID
jgi:surfactin synthase thioesterase subunit